MHTVLISADLAAAAAGGAIEGEVHSVFEHAVNITFGDGDWLTLLTDEEAIGPMSAVLRTQNFKSCPLVAGMKAEIGRGRLHVQEAGLTVVLKGPAVWQPNPEPVKDPVDLLTLKQRLEKLEDWIRSSGNLSGIGNVMDHLELPDRKSRLRTGSELNAFGQFALERINGLVHFLSEGERERMREKVRGIAGFGPGLTPSGDDFLAGMGASILFLGPCHRMKKAAVDALLRMIWEESANRTTRVSEEMLKHLASGRIPMRFARLQQALLSRTGPDLDSALQALGRMGETSGTDHALGVWVTHRVLVSEETRRKLG